ncbi:aminomethyltransferase beta-barrel domain-containing protein, partial [Limosilactobacillus fermentum]
MQLGLRTMWLDVLQIVQCQGLGLGGTKENNDPWFVIGKDITKNVLYVGQGYENEHLYATHMEASDIHWVDDVVSRYGMEFHCTAKFRYRQKDEGVTVKLSDDGQMVTVTSDDPARAITPGQAVVFYDGDECFGRMPLSTGLTTRSVNCNTFKAKRGWGKDSLAFFAFHFQRPSSPLLQFSLYWRLARTPITCCPTTDLVAKYGRRAISTTSTP